MRNISIAVALTIGFSVCVGDAAASAPSGAPPAVSVNLGPDPVDGMAAAYLSARFAADHHDYSKAAELFAKCLEKDGKNPLLLSSAFFYAIAAGQIETGADYAQRLLAVSSGQRIANLTIATVAMKRGDFKAAREVIAKSHRDGVVAFPVNIFEAWIAAGAGDRKSAQGILEGLKKQSAVEAVVLFNEAAMAEYFDDAAQADVLYRKLLQQSSEVSPRLAEAYGRFLERSGKNSQALAFYGRILADPALSSIAATGKARIAQGQKPAALVSSAQDGAAEALLGVATSLSDENGADISIAFLHLAKHLRPDFELADLLMADRYEVIGDYDAAIAIYDKIPPQSPYYRVSALQNSSDKNLSKREDGALKDLETVVGRFPDDASVWTVYGDVLGRLKKYAEAVKAYDRAAALVGTPTKKDWALYFARANAAQNAGDWESAERDLTLALKLNPNEPQILNFLGYTWVDQNRNLRQGVSMLEKANRLAPNDGYITDSVGWAYYRLGRYADAAEMLERAVLLTPQDPTINDHLGDVYWKLGRKLDAEFQWNHALAFGPADEDKAKIAKKLQAIPAGE